MKKQSGQISVLIPMYLMLFVLVVIAYSLQKYQYNATKIYTEDALAASNLASAVADIQEYGISHNIVIAEPDNAFELYKEAIQINMGLDTNWESANKKMISGRVDVIDYIVYNVSGNDVDVYCYGENSYHTFIADGLGSVRAPNGQKIENTSIYSKISFPVDGIFDIHTIAEKDKLVDVVGN